MLALTTDENEIVVQNLVKKRHLQLENFHSLKISVQFTMRSGPYLDLILLRHVDVVEQIPLNYIDNLNQIIEELEKQLRNATEDDHGVLRHIREISQNQ